MLRSGSCINTEDTGILITRQERIDGIGKAALFTDFLKKPGRHAAAEQRRQQRCGIKIFILAADTIKAEDDVNLFKVALDADVAAFVAGRLAAVAGRFGQAGEGVG